MGGGREGGMGNLSVDTILRFLLVVRVSDLTPPGRAAIGQNLVHSHLLLPPPHHNKLADFSSGQYKIIVDYIFQT